MRPSESPDERPSEKRGERDDSQAKQLGAYLRYSHLGLQFALSIGLPVAGGYWLDGELGTKAVFTIIGLVLGFGVGTYALYFEIYRREGRGRGKHRDDADRGTDEASGRDGERDRK